KNGTNSTTDLDSIKKEIGTRLEEIGRVAEATNFNGVEVFEDKEITIQIGDKDVDTITIKLNKLDLDTLGLKDFLSDFADIGITMNGAGIASSQYEKAATKLVDGTDTGVDSGGNGVWKFSTAEADIFKQAIEDNTGAAPAGNVEIYQLDGEVFAHDVAADKMYKVDASAITFDKHDADNTKAKVTAVDDAGLTALSAEDTDMLVKGPSKFNPGSSTELKEGAQVKQPGAGGNVFDLDAARLDAIAAAAFGPTENAESSGMKMIMMNDGTDDRYFVYGGDDGAGNKVLKEITFNATGVPAATDVRPADADIVKKEIGVGTADNLLENLDNAINKIADFRSDLGAVQNRFSSIIANLNTNIINTTEARSRIQDADFSVEVSAMSRANILQSAGISVLAQANQVPQNVLSLLR
ncbi:flagellin, partial [Pantoea agglomerans]